MDRSYASRRQLLFQAAVMAGAALSPAAWTSAVAQTRLPDYPFKAGVASGEPLPDGVVLWTRLVADPQAMGIPFAPVTTGSLGLRVPALEQAFEQLKQAGHALNDAVLDTPVCHAAFVRDSEGNTLVLHRLKA